MNELATKPPPLDTDLLDTDGVKCYAEMFYNTYYKRLPGGFCSFKRLNWLGKTLLTLSEFWFKFQYPYQFELMPIMKQHNDEYWDWMNEFNPKHVILPVLQYSDLPARIAMKDKHEAMHFALLFKGEHYGQ